MPQVRYWLWLSASVKFLIPLAWLVALGAQISPHTFSATPPQLSALTNLYDSGTAVATSVSLMEQSLLVERFGLRVHFETMEAPVYALVIAKGGSKLPPAAEGEPSRLSDLGTPSENDMAAKTVTISEFANSPLLRIGSRQIIDRTDLQGPTTSR